jgi:hypothetical protein
VRSLSPTIRAQAKRALAAPVRAAVKAGAMAIVDAVEGVDVVVAWEAKVVGLRKPMSVISVGSWATKPGNVVQRLRKIRPM